MAGVTYDISIQTSEHYKKGGTDSTVSIQLVGEDDCETQWHNLDNFFRDDFEQGRTDSFTIEDEDVGSILMIRLRLKHCGEKDSWACDIVTIKHGKCVEDFPVYDWIFNEMEIINGKGILPQRIKSDLVRQIVTKEREHNRVRFAWTEKAKPGDAAWLLPRFVPAENLHSLPHLMRMEDARFERIEDLRSVAKFNVIFETLIGYLFPIKKLDDYKHLFIHFRISNDIKPFIEKWDQDEEQGRQMLNGANPFSHSRCDVLPPHCKIQNHHVDSLLNDGKTLETEIKEGRIFIVDYSTWTKGLPRNQQYKSRGPLYCADVLALFYAPGNGKFLPIAIQLEPEIEESIFTPNDEKYDWMLAKMYFRCADSNAHQWIYHFLWSHNVVETGATAMLRCLSRTHPMYKLCRPHLQHVVAIDQFARDILIFENSTSNYTRSINGSNLARNVITNFDFNELNFPKLLKKRGLDSDKLQNYHYRHDAQLLWNSIEKYVSKMVLIYYKSNEDVQQDHQIQDWAHDLAHEGLGWADGNTKGCPSSLESIDELVSFVTSLVFTSSVQHTAMHKPMFDIYKFIPNAPGGMRMPIHKRGEGSLQRVLDSLPDITMATILFGSNFVLTELPENEIYLGDFPMKFFTEPEPLAVLEDFQQDLKAVSDVIKERNKHLEFPYEYLLPEGVSAGTTA